MTKLEGILRLPVRLVYSCKSVLRCRCENHDVVCSRSTVLGHYAVWAEVCNGRLLHIDKGYVILIYAFVVILFETVALSAKENTLRNISRVDCCMVTWVDRRRELRGRNIHTCFKGATMSRFSAFCMRARVFLAQKS